MSPLKVFISGSGIAGTVFACCLLRAYPTALITIVERDRSLRLTGASVDIRNSAVDIIKQMGVEQEIRKKTTNKEGIQLVDVHGKEIATFRATGREDVQSLTSEYEIFRGELAGIFTESVKKRGRVRVVFDETVESYVQHDDGVVVTLSKSKEVEKFDMLVGADGLGSKIRVTILGAHPSEPLYDEGVHVAYFTIKKDLPN